MPLISVMVIGKGIHSPLIFALMMEPLVASIRANPWIHAILAGLVPHKIGLYMDEVILLLTSSGLSIRDKDHPWFIW